MKILQSCTGPLTAEEVRARVADVDLVTVYRTLQSLHAAELAHEVRFKDGVMRYELSGGHHHHLVCTDCGVVEELEACDVEPLEKKVLKNSRGFKTISEHALEFFGLCNKCA